MLITGVYIEDHVRKQDFRVFFDRCAAGFPRKNRIAVIYVSRIGDKSVSESGKKCFRIGDHAAIGHFTGTCTDSGFRIIAVCKA